jgi:tetratricopeptide (TPR) repeat protein
MWTHSRLVRTMRADAAQSEPLPGRHCLLAQLARAQQHRFGCIGDTQDLEDAVASARSAIAAYQAEGVVCPEAQMLAGDIFEERYETLNDPDDMERATALCRDVVTSCSSSHPLRARALNILGVVCRRRCQIMGESGGVDEAIGLHTEAYGTRGLCYPDQHRTCRLLADALRMLYCMEGDEKHLEEAICFYREALNCCPPRGYDRVVILEHYSLALGHRFDSNRSLEDLEAAIELVTLCLSLKDPRFPGYSSILASLSMYLLKRFELQAKPEDMAEVIRLRREAVRHCPVTQAQRWQYLDNLACILCNSYDSYGRLEDLEEAIELWRDTIGQMPTDHFWLLHTRSNLAAGLHFRYSELGDKEDLDEAIDLFRRSGSALSPSNPENVSAVETLTACLRTRFEAYHIDADIEECLLLSRSAAETLPTSHMKYDDTVRDLASALLLRGKAKEQLADAEEAARLLQQLMLRDMPDLFRPRILCVLAQSYLTKFNIGREPQDLLKCLEVNLKQLSLLPPGHRGRSQCLLQLAELHLLQDAPYHDPLVTLNFLYEALEDDYRDVRGRLQDVVRTLNILESNESPSGDTRYMEKLLLVYCTVVRLLPRLAFFGLDLSSRLQDLAVGRNIAITGAIHALRLLRPREALEILEQGRAIFWTHALRLRSEYDAVPEAYRHRLESISRQLGWSNEVVDYSAPDKPALERALAGRRKMAEEFHRILAEVRTLPGLERFMLHPEFSALAKVAEAGPVVVLVEGMSTCHAVVLRSPTHVTTLPLQFATKDWVAASSNTWRLVVNEERSALRDQRLNVKKQKTKPHSNSDPMDSILEGIWSRVAHPILECLELKASP